MAGKIGRWGKAYHAMQLAAIWRQHDDAGRAKQAKALEQGLVFRPVGGGIEFGETSAQAIVREVQEELDQTVDHLRLVGTLESLFTYNNTPGHEIVQVYDGQFRDQRLYQMACLTGHESDGMAFQVTWQDSSAFTNSAPLVPEGLYPLLKNAGLLD